MLAAFSICAIEAGGQTKSDQKKAKKIAVEGDRSFKQGDYKTAVNKFAQATLLAPDNPMANFWHFQKGKAHFYLKELDQSLGELDAAFNQGFTRRSKFIKFAGS